MRLFLIIVAAILMAPVIGGIVLFLFLLTGISIMEITGG